MRIRREDVDAVRERARIDEVVGEYVALRSAGVGSLKGLCPFHDEKTPSFHVRPQVGLFHCFGCDEGGDVIAFVQKMDHLPFAEAVERLAGRVGLQLRYDEEGAHGSARGEHLGRRRRLVEANQLAAQLYAEQLATHPDAAPGRTFLAERGFARADAERFGVGFAPRGGEVLLQHLRGRGFTEDELVAAGLAGRGRRGLYDRFRGRLVWPIRDVTADVLGFGARRLLPDDPIEAKYLNTPDTAIYHKSQVLYGIDLAKREIARQRTLVVVEGYTDVMACHLAGVTTAVATCGTAFGADHIRVARRMVGDDVGSQVIFTFDGDAAGRAAALKAFAEDQRFVAQTSIAVARDGLDPCDLRLRHGDQAVLDLIAQRRPLFEFAIRSTLEQTDLDTAEGRVHALRVAAPVVAGIRDPALRPEYARRLAGWLGMEVETVSRAVIAAARSGAAAPSGSRPGPAGPVAAPDSQRAPAPARVPDPADPVVRTEQQALECILQVPRLVPAAEIDALAAEAFTVPAFAAVHAAVRAAGGMAVAVGLSGPAWLELVREHAPAAVEALVTRLAVTPLPADSDEATQRYAVSVVLRVVELELTRRIADLRSRVQRGGGPDGARQALSDLMAAETQRRELRERINGG